MITKDGFLSWLRDQLEGYPIEPGDVSLVRFTPETVHKGEFVEMDVFVNCRDEDGNLYIDPHIDDVAREIHRIPVKSLT